MKASRTKALIAVVVLAGALAYLLWAGVSAGKGYSMDVDSFLANPNFHSQQVNLRGVVAPDNIKKDPAARTITFLLRGKEKVLPVTFTGVVPDLFAPDAEVLVEGRLGPDKIFHAGKLLTKCASKYTGDNAKGGQKP